MARLIYYVVAEYGGKKWTWAWNRTDLIPEKRTDDEFAEAASKAGHDLQYCAIYSSYGISKWDAEKLTLKVLAAIRSEFPGKVISRFDIELDTKVRVRLN